MEDGLWTMRTSLADALDQISSIRATLETRSKAFEVIEKHLAAAFSSRDDKDKEALGHFLALQYTFECNVPLRLLAWITLATAQLERLTKGSVDESHGFETFILASQLTQALSLLQGIALSHVASKDYLGRKYPLEVLLDLLLASRHMPSPRSDEDPASPRKPSLSSLPLTSIVLDTLLCILVDSSTALRSFEEASGPQAVVRILKRAGTPREVRMKCLEFLYFYLLDETTPAVTSASEPEPSPASEPSAPLSVSTPQEALQRTSPTTAPATPIRPAKKYLGIGAGPRRRPSSVYGSSTYAFTESPSLSVKPPQTPGSRSTSGSSTISYASTSSNVSSLTTATSVSSSPEKPSALKLALSNRDKEREKDRLGLKKSSSRLPPEISTSPSTSTSSDGWTRTTPSTPPPTASRPSSRHQHQLFASFSSSRSSSSKGGDRAGGEGGRPFRFPAPVQPRMMMLKKEVEYEPISPVKATPPPLTASPLPSLNTTAQPHVKSPIGLGLPGSRHSKSKSMSNVLSGSGGSQAGDELKRVKSRLGSAATVPILESVKEREKAVPVPVPQRSATGVGNSEKEYGKDVKERDGENVKRKTTEEKTQLLATMLGNVDALVAGVRKAGVWGLG